MESNPGVGGIVADEDRLISSEFNVFKKPQYYKDIIKTLTELLRPQNLGGENGIPLHYELPPDDTKWTDLSSAKIHGRYRVYNETKEAEPAASENFSVVCGLAWALWSKIIFLINGTEVCMCRFKKLLIKFSVADC